MAPSSPILAHPELTPALIPPDAAPSEAVSALARTAARLLGARTPVLARPRGDDLQLVTWPADSSGAACLADAAILGLCREVISDAGPLALANLRSDLRFRREWTGYSGDAIAFIAVPLPTDAGAATHALALLDPVARHWAPDDIAALQDIARAMAGELDRQRVEVELVALRSALAHSDARYHRVLAASPNGIYVIDRQGCMVELNDSATAILDRPAADVIGKPFQDFVAPEDHRLATSMFREALVSGAAHAEIELRVVRPTGERRTIQITRTTVEEDGQIVAIQGLARDVTDERAKEVQLRRAERMAAVAPLLTGVCHELNNPLTSIRSFAELMLMDPRPDDDREALEIVQREAERAGKIVSDLRVVARQSQEPDAGSEAVQINDLLRQTIEQHRESLAAADVTIVQELSPDLPPTWAVRPQLEQVIHQLLSNALHAMRGQPVPRELTVRSFRGDLGIAVLVADTGVGIGADCLDRIFDPFWTTRDAGEGTGLGLSLAHSIIADLGGRIRVDSQPGHGASFTVELPVCPICTPVEDPEPVKVSASRPLRILIVDDEAPIRFSITRYMERRGHIVQGASEGGAALNLLEDSTNGESYDIIVADLRMPGLDGEQLLARLRQRGDGLERRLIFMTGDAESPEADRVLRDAGAPVVRKPFDLAEIAQIIEVQAGMMTLP